MERRRSDILLAPMSLAIPLTRPLARPVIDLAARSPRDFQINELAGLAC